MLIKTLEITRTEEAFKRHQHQEHEKHCQHKFRQQQENSRE